MELRTIEEYKATLRRALTPEGELRPEVRAWGRSPRIVLRAALAWSAKVGQRSREQANRLRDEVPSTKGERRKRAAAPDAAQVSAYREAVEKLEPIERAIALLPFYMGFRASELLSISRGKAQAAVKHGEVTFIRKGGKTATLPLNESTKPLFEALLKNTDAEWRTVGDLLASGKPKSQLVAFERLLKKIAESVTEEGERFDWHPHALRHAFAIQMRKRGAPLKVIQAWLGHENVATTDLYLGAADPTEGMDYLPK